MVKGLSFNIPKLSDSKEIARPDPVINRYRPARHLKTNKAVFALQLTPEQAALAQRLMNMPGIEHMDYLIAHRDGTVRCVKRMHFADTYYFIDGPDNADE